MDIIKNRKNVMDIQKETRWNFYGVLSSLFYIVLYINN